MNNINTEPQTESQNNEAEIENNKNTIAQSDFCFGINEDGQIVRNEYENSIFQVNRDKVTNNFFFDIERIFEFSSVDDIANYLSDIADVLKYGKRVKK